MSNTRRHTSPSQASSPDADRAGAPVPPPDWLVNLLVTIILFLRRHLGRHQVPSWWHDRPDLPPGSAQALGAAIRGDFGNAIAWMCLRRGIGPGHKDWPELSRAIVRFGGSLQRFRPGMPALGLQWWENPELVPGMIGMDTPTPAADAMAALLSRQEAAEASPAGLRLVPISAEHADTPAFPRAMSVRAITGPPSGPRAGPPTGPPAGRSAFTITTHQRGQSMAGPAILIRAAAIAHRLRLAA